MLLSPQPLANTNLFSVAMDVPILGVSYKCSHMICGILCLSAWCFCPCCSMCQYFMPFCGWAVVRHRDMPYCVYSFTHWWLLRLLLLFGCYYEDALNMCVDIFSFLFGIYLGVESLGLMVTVYITFWGTAKLFSEVQQWLRHFTFPPAT